MECPTVYDLMPYVNGRLREINIQRHHQLARHCRQCESCQKSVKQLKQDKKRGHQLKKALAHVSFRQLERRCQKAMDEKDGLTLAVITERCQCDSMKLAKLIAAIITYIKKNTERKVNLYSDSLQRISNQQPEWEEPT